MLRVSIATAVAWGGLAGAQAMYAYATTSPRFEVRTVVFQETAHVNLDHLRGLMGIEPATNILSVDLEALAAKIEADPWVAKAVVERELPDALVVRVEEHTAHAVVAAGHFYLVDADGKPFKRVGTGERGSLPVITGIPRELLVNNLEAAATQIRSGLSIRALWESKQRPRLAEIHLGQAGEVTLYTAEAGTQLRLRTTELSERLERYDALRAALGERADRLAVVHLDSTLGRGTTDRIVARFIDPNDELAVLSRPETQETLDGALNPDSSATQPVALTQTSTQNAPVKRERKHRIPRAQ